MSPPPDELCSREGNVRVYDYLMPDGLAVNGPAEAVFAAHARVGRADWAPELVSDRISARTGIAVSAWDGRPTDARLSADSWLVGLRSLRCRGLYRWTFVMTPREYGLRTFDSPLHPSIEGRRWVGGSRLKALGYDVDYVRLEAEEQPVAELRAEPSAVVAPLRAEPGGVNGLPAERIGGPVGITGAVVALPQPARRPPIPLDATSFFALMLLASPFVGGALLGATTPMRGQAYRRMLRGWRFPAASIGGLLAFGVSVFAGYSGTWAALLALLTLAAGATVALLARFGYHLAMGAYRRKAGSAWMLEFPDDGRWPEDSPEPRSGAEAGKWKKVALWVAGIGAFLLFTAMLTFAHGSVYAILLGMVLLPVALALQRSEAATPPQAADTLEPAPPGRPPEPGRFEYLRIIGRGAASEVWEARDREMGGRQVAVKRRQFLATPIGIRARQLFIQEARTVAKLSHPNIVKILDLVEDGGELLLVFEFIEGRTLTQAILERGPMPAAEVARIIRPICDAVAYAHSNGLVHRDIKPSNVMLAESGEIKLTDFGIARALQYDFESTRRIVGSPAYMAPELKRGTVSKQADIFALGACCVEMLTGKVPTDPPRLGEVAPRVPTQLAAALERALSPEAIRRQSSVEEFAKAISAAAG